MEKSTHDSTGGANARTETKENVVGSCMVVADCVKRQTFSASGLILLEGHAIRGSMIRRNHTSEQSDVHLYVR